MARSRPQLRIAAALLAAAALAACSSSDEPARARAPAAAGPVLWAIGDGGTGGIRSRQVARLVAREQPARVLYLGDVYDDGEMEDFENFDSVFGRLTQRMWPTPGNHEWPNHARGYDPYWKRVRGRPLAHWYAVRIAGWQVLSLNSEASHDHGSAQLRWLRARLTGRTTCRIAIWHRPRFSAGKHDDQHDVAPLWDAVKGRVALVLSGHDHNLQRFEPIDGTVQIVSGAAGRHRYGVDEDDPRLAFSDDKHFGGVRIELRRRRAVLTFIAVDGSMLDRSAVRCTR